MTIDYDEPNRRLWREDIPVRMRMLPLDRRGYPVPWFVAWLRLDGTECKPGEGTPDFRVIGSQKIVRAVRERRCWLCGLPLGSHLAFVIGPMCAVNRINSEPPSHRDCARFALQACPFLSNPNMRRNERIDLPPGSLDAPGLHLDRNPGVMAMWITRTYRLVHVDGIVGNPGTLFELGTPSGVEWWAKGQPAKRVDVEAALHSGLSILKEQAERDGLDAVKLLAQRVDDVGKYLPVV